MEQMIDIAALTREAKPAEAATTGTPTMGKFELALALVQALDARLARGEYLRDADGQLLTELDQVVLAILENRWPGEGVAE